MKKIWTKKSKNWRVPDILRRPQTVLGRASKFYGAFQNFYAARLKFSSAPEKI